MAPYGIPRRSFSAKEEEPLPVNWRRGLFRVWLLFSAAWMMGWIIYLVMYGLQGGFKTTGDFLVIPVLLFGPPIALLLFGLAAGCLRIPSFSNDPINTGKRRQFEQHGRESFDQRPQAELRHHRYKFVEHGSLTKQRMSALF